MGSKINSGCSCIIIAQKWQQSGGTKVKQMKRFSFECGGCFRTKLKKKAAFAGENFLSAYGPISILVTQ